MIRKIIFLLKIAPAMYRLYRGHTIHKNGAISVFFSGNPQFLVAEICVKGRVGASKDGDASALNAIAGRRFGFGTAKYVLFTEQYYK
jgi:hypothetical protein